LTGPADQQAAKSDACGSKKSAKSDEAVGGALATGPVMTRSGCAMCSKATAVRTDSGRVTTTARGSQNAWPRAPRASRAHSASTASVHLMVGKGAGMNDTGDLLLGPIIVSVY